MPKTRRMRRLEKLGLFVILKRPTPENKPPLPLPLRPTRLAYSPGAVESPLSHSKEKRRAIIDRMADEHEPSDSIEVGNEWSMTRPTDPEVFVTGVSSIRLKDGSSAKYFRVAVKPSVLQARARQEHLDRIEKAKRDELEREAKQKEISRETKKKRAKLRRKLRELDKSYLKAVRQEARLQLFLMGKF